MRVLRVLYEGFDGTVTKLLLLAFLLALVIIFFVKAEDKLKLFSLLINYFNMFGTFTFVILLHFPLS